MVLFLGAFLLGDILVYEAKDEFVKAIDQSQIIMFPGGFSAGDEPDGSAKFFATAFQNEKIKEAVMKLLNERDGLALGICNVYFFNTHSCNFFIS